MAKRSTNFNGGRKPGHVLDLMRWVGMSDKEIKKALTMSDYERDMQRRIQALPQSTFALAATEWQRHECDSDSDVCGCIFRFKCTQCGADQTTFGESMSEIIGIGGKCEGCHYGVQEEAIRRFPNWDSDLGGPSDMESWRP